eukprot:CAMPEP_0118646858 /NCGR_PEP_ID=MMETSP0785-20121206/8291_1 /TAXON_ID=91992 /ORGANISM="Bolidomonas pacifica, Strain CCMP 1866" /LENGTH=323 /DNA_ID=CAMNT_0006538901 /DNA_START=188 /DNA_END=1156 /DNA_ORIENTATION=+
MGRKSKPSSSVLLSSDASTRTEIKDERIAQAQKLVDYVKPDADASHYQVSDSDSEDADVVLGTSRSGLLKKYDNIGATYNRTWTAGEDEDVDVDEDKEMMIQEWLRAKEEGDKTEEQLRVLEKKIGEEKEKLEEVRQKKRRMESEENAGRDPCLFSKRTAFDISLTLVEDKPWLRTDPTDFFNYEMGEDEWEQYAEEQKMIRQELLDASKQRRVPDRNIVKVERRAPRADERVTSSTSNNDDDEKGGEIGPKGQTYMDDPETGVRPPGMQELVKRYPKEAGAWLLPKRGGLMEKLIMASKKREADGTKFDDRTIFNMQEQQLN